MAAVEHVYGYMVNSYTIILLVQGAQVTSNPEIDVDTTMSVAHSS